MGALCRERGLWFHVDGAHGAAHLLSARDRHRLAGIDLADSVVWDAHKLLQTSSLCAAVLVRDAATLRAAFHLDAAYIVDELADVGTDVIEHQLECTKSPLGLKLALVLAFTGEAGMARHVDGLTDRAAELAALIAQRPGFAILGPPESNIVCFRHTAVDDEGTARLRRSLLQDGAFHLTQADVAGHRWLRLTVMNPTTDASVLDRLLDAISRAVQALEPR
jgi:L-2,4-diaminobutyrate decarboxylase